MSVYQNKIAFFQKAEVDESIEKIYWVTYRPIAPIQEGTAVEFSIPGTSKDLVDLSQSKLYVKAKIVESGGSNIGTAAKVGPINLTLHSLWRQAELQLNQVNVSNSVGTNNPYKCLLDVVLKQSEDVKESVLQSELYFKDEGNMESSEGIEASNRGFYYRVMYSAGSNSFDMIGPLRSFDLAHQDKLIFNGVALSMRFFPTTDAFRLMESEADKTFKLIIEEVKLYLCYVELKPSVTIGIEQQLTTTPGIYSFMRSDFKTFNIPTGSYDFVVDDIFAGQIPSKLIATLVLSEAYTGSFSKNPFNFQNFWVRSIEFCVDSAATPCSAFQPNYDTGNFIAAYNALALTEDISGKGNDITRLNFGGGYAIYCFNIDSNYKDGLFPQKKSGHSRISLRFGKALTASVTLILYAVFPDEFKIDKSRAIIQS